VSAAPLRILHTIAGLWVETGGPASSVPQLCRELAHRGNEVTLLTGAGDMAASVRGPLPFRRVVVALGPYWAANASEPFLRAMMSEAYAHDIVHDHGLWLFTNWASARATRKARKPWVCSPRGTLERWALSRSRWRKWVAWRMFQGTALRRASRIHATSPGEAEAVRRILNDTRIEIIPNGVDVEGEFARPVATEVDPGSRDVRFLGRIHPVKGLDTLLAAWRLVATPEATLTIAGGGEWEHVHELELGMAALGSGSTVRYVGPLARETRAGWLAKAHVVVLPSHSENYGMVVAEALACEAPVITTTGTPWSEVREANCGWWVSPTVEGIAAALREALALSAERRREMGQRGRRLVEARHSSAAAAARMEDMYRQVLDERARVGCVGRWKG
jgi:glycosyltransferase involved in cell wall biosynthesis